MCVTWKTNLKSDFRANDIENIKISKLLYLMDKFIIKNCKNFLMFISIGNFLNNLTKKKDFTKILLINLFYSFYHIYLKMH